MTKLPSQQCQEDVFNGKAIVPNADIAGTGVIIAFLSSAYLTFVLVVVAYVFGLVDDELLSPVDRRIFRIKGRAAQYPRIFTAIRKAVLTLSDQQVITGIAVMGAAFNGLRDGSIDKYHYQVAIYLAWLSSSVHLSALTLLGPYLNRRPAIKIWRVVGMAVLGVMLIIGLIPTISSTWSTAYPDRLLQDLDEDDSNLTPFYDMLMQNNTWGVKASCWWMTDWDRIPNINDGAPLSYVILLVGYIWKIGGLFASSSRFARLTIWAPLNYICGGSLMYFARKHKDTGNYFYKFMFRFLLAVYAPIFVGLDTLKSLSASIWLSLTGLLWGSVQVITTRQEGQIPTYKEEFGVGPLESTVAEKENEWGFGQLIPLILLVAPLGAITEAIQFSNKKHGQARAFDAESHMSADEVSLAELRQRGEMMNKNAHLGSATDLGSPKRRKPKTRGLSDHLMGHLSGGQRGSELPFSELWTETMLGLKRYKFLLILLQLVIAGLAGILAWIDWSDIGYASSDDWFYMLTALAVYIGMAYLSLGIFFLFQSVRLIGRHDDRMPRLEENVNENVWEGNRIH